MVAAMAAGCGSSSDDTSAEGDAAATTEEDGGESGSWDAANMITAVTREEGSGTRGAFTELFGVVDEGDNDYDHSGRSDYKQHISYDDNCI